jgi:hypothetical protein
MKTMTIELDFGSIVVEINAEGVGTISSDLHEEQAGAEELEGFQRYEGGIDVLESLILAHALAGVDIQAVGYVEGIKTTLEALENNCCPF